MKFTREHLDKIRKGISFCIWFGTIIALAYYIYSQIQVDDTIYQKVTRLSEKEQNDQYYAWRNEHEGYSDLTLSDSSLENNPFNSSKPMYKLVTEVNDYEQIDYGTEKEITALKCQRFAEYTAIVQNDKRLDSIAKIQDVKADEFINKINSTNCKSK